MSKELPGGARAQTVLPLDLLLARYAGGSLTSRELSCVRGLAFGEILVELGKRNLALPRVSPKRTPALDSLLERALRGPQ